jgi:gamma-glutamyltranspeptidase/glutathione hydrolase
MGYTVETVERTYSPTTAIFIDRENGSLWGGASEQGDDYGISW